MELQGLTSKTYLTKRHLCKIFKKDLTQDEIDGLLFSGKIQRHFSYYKATIPLLRELDIIPDKVAIGQEHFSKIAKRNGFSLWEIAEMFGGLHQDVALLVTEKYFYKKYNYWYKNDLLNEMLMDGEEEFGI